MAKLHKPLVIIAAIAIAGGIGYALVSTAMFFAFGPGAAPAAAPVAERPAAGPVAPPIEQVIGWRLFGQPPTDYQADDKDETESLQETKLKLKLVGVFVADDAASSMALIAEKGGKPQAYQIGARMTGNAKLDAIFLDRVVISRGGRRELIRLADPPDALLPVSAATEPAGAADVADGAAPPTRRRQALAQRGEAKPQALAALRADFQERPAELLADLGVGRVSEDAAGGYAIESLADRPAVRRIGLQRGDRVLSINGRPLGDPQQDRLRVDDVLAEGKAHLEVQRGDERLAITVALDSLN